MILGLENIYLGAETALFGAETLWAARPYLGAVIFILAHKILILE